MKKNGSILDRRKEISKRKEKRWEKQRQKILSATGRLMWKKGYVGTSIDDIARSCKMNKAVIYYYFKDKSELLYEIVTIVMNALLNHARPIAESDLRPSEKLKAIIRGQIEWQANHLGIAGIGHVERKNLPFKLRHNYVNMRDEYEGIIRMIIEDGMEKGEFSFSSSKLASFLTLGLSSSIMQWFNTKGEFSCEEISSETWKYICKALKNE